MQFRQITKDKAVNRAVIPVDGEAQLLKFTIQSIGKNPEGSAGAGEDGWMFVSEILVY